MKEFLILSLLCLPLVLALECVPEYSAEAEKARKAAGKSWIACDGKICSKIDCNTNCCDSSGVCMMTTASCVNIEYQKQWQQQFQEIASER